MDSIETAPSPEISARRPRRGVLMLFVLIVASSMFEVYRYPTGSVRHVRTAGGITGTFELFGASRGWVQEGDRGRANFLDVRIASHVRGLRDTTTLWRETRLALPLAESLVAQTGDTLIRISHVSYPLSRLIPFRMTEWTYYHRQPNGQWQASFDLRH